MRNLFCSSLLVMLMAFVSLPTKGQIDSILSLEELLNMKITVSSVSELTPRESPGIVTVITKDEIKKSGARDLIDLLRLVPGFEFGVDVENVINASIRGSWAHEGKMLMLWDGQEMNELSYSTLQLGNHYPVSQIKRIEIIRGPGSSIYGGYAELGVINIVTKHGGDLNGFEADATYGQLKDVYGRQNLSLSAGKKINDFEFSLHGFMGKGTMSEKEYTDMFGDKYDLADNSETNPLMFNAGLKYKGLNLRFIHDKYQTTMRDGFFENLTQSYGVDYISTLAEIKYDFKIGEKLTITPKYNYKNTKPFYASEKAPADENPVYMAAIYKDRNVVRSTGGLKVSINPTPDINLLAGLEYYIDKAKDNLDDASRTYWDGSKEIEYNNLGFYLQGLLKSRIVNLTAGMRIDKHSEFGSAFAPRIGLTKVFDKLHLKFLYSQAYRSPGIENIDLNAYLNPDLKPDIEPEETEVIELEAGYKINSDMFITANLFNQKIDHTIVYYIDENGNEGYKNVERTGSQGIEIEYRVKKHKWFATLNYSYHNTDGINKAPDYIVHADENALLGAPMHKICLNTSFNITDKLSINPSFTYLGERWAYTYYNPSLDNVVQEKLDPLFMANIYILYENLFTQGLDFGIGAYDFLDSGYEFIQPYNGWHSPMPARGREIILKLSYRFSK